MQMHTKVQLYEYGSGNWGRVNRGGGGGAISSQPLSIALGGHIEPLSHLLASFFYHFLPKMVDVFSQVIEEMRFYLPLRPTPPQPLTIEGRSSLPLVSYRIPLQICPLYGHGKLRALRSVKRLQPASRKNKMSTSGKRHCLGWPESKRWNACCPFGWRKVCGSGDAERVGAGEEGKQGRGGRDVKVWGDGEALGRKGRGGGEGGLRPGRGIVNDPHNFLYFLNKNNNRGNSVVTEIKNTPLRVEATKREENRQGW